ncbi:MAG: precorrin-6Y C5,15-methyltransferase (decarboxylating) subunit CbiT [Lachnospiraceae bacterium]|nr:precorrin-6Y C5,15-methyltransferase (decarboxylating) subunit CbiT [Lachnospiraceae bacterium]
MSDKRVYFISCGTGKRAALTRRALKALTSCDTWIGPRSLLDAMQDPGNEKAEPNLIREEEGGDMAALIREAPGENIAVLVGGDAGANEKVCASARAIPELAPTIFPGIPEVSEFSARTGISYEGAAILDLTDGRGSLLQAVLRHRKVFARMDNYTSLYLEDMKRAGFGDLRIGRMMKTAMGRDRVEYGRLSDMADHLVSEALYFFYRKDRPSLPALGIPDDAFVRGNIPMTKREVRTQIIAALMPEEDDIICDIGAGTGSVTVEMAMQAVRGTVCAIEEKAEGVDLIRENVKKFGLHNVEIVRGTAPDAFSRLPVPNVAFIGGSGGHFRDIFQVLVSRNPEIRIGVTAISPETASEAVERMELYHMDPQMICMNVSRSKKAGRNHMMMAQNPVYLIWGQKKEEEEGGVG